MFSLIVLVVFCFSCATAAPSARSISLRQSNAPVCVENVDCYPEAFANVTIPLAFVECVGGQCSCSDCFFLNDTANSCYINPPCTDYNANTGQCTDNRRKTLTAFLLTFFLVPTGAANFYIDRLDFAIPQLILGIIYIFFQCCVMPCVRKCAKDAKENDDGCKGLISCALCIPYCLLAMLFFSWWIADLVIFGTNQRLDGDSCDLIDNL